ncbi:MAG: DUF1801 domain-containing protein [Acidimicrobiales bacterium]
MTEWKPPTEVKLLSGGNPQIPKGDGDEPVRVYIEHMPEWKRDLGERIDQLIAGAVPSVYRKVRWNQPFYGVDADTVFASFRCFTKKVQIAFHNGASLDPEPPKSSKHPEVRYLDIHEDDDLDEQQLSSWFGQASDLPGETM